ncbi:unnamed protein product [Owenia fusiformis]|uniref:Uncharacterized protein n=1 Tax=Owenia fusiformis TaxID=6347 RepID=A0A8S4QBC0_OWEFU|nr:unnamed protein product [Owenia fusiformis]
MERYADMYILVIAQSVQVLPCRPMYFYYLIIKFLILRIMNGIAVVILALCAAAMAAPSHHGHHGNHHGHGYGHGDENRDGVPDALDANRDGKVDSYAHGHHAHGHHAHGHHAHGHHAHGHHAHGHHAHGHHAHGHHVYADENRDGVPDALDANRDGKLELHRTFQGCI